MVFRMPKTNGDSHLSSIKTNFIHNNLVMKIIIMYFQIIIPVLQSKRKSNELIKKNCQKVLESLDRL